MKRQQFVYRPAMVRDPRCHGRGRLLRMGDPVASVQKTSLRVSGGKSVEENVGHFPRLPWAKTPGFLRV